MVNYDSDVVKLLVQLVRELRSENEMLKGELMKRSMKASISDLLAEEMAKNHGTSSS